MPREYRTTCLRRHALGTREEFVASGLRESTRRWGKLRDKTGAGSIYTALKHE